MQYTAGLSLLCDPQPQGGGQWRMNYLGMGRCGTWRSRDLGCASGSTCVHQHKAVPGVPARPGRALSAGSMFAGNVVWSKCTRCETQREGLERARFECFLDCRVCPGRGWLGLLLGWGAGARRPGGLSLLCVSGRRNPCTPRGKGSAWDFGALVPGLFCQRGGKGWKIYLSV